ncbi:MAG: hypothetical protein JXB15_00460 [Anaerolineales bacterium]|nr:hypothetical protein [Anaerolineales bacterium]
MRRKLELLNRLEAVAVSLQRSRNALALIGLGSVGADLERLDDYSDLDFFVIIRPGSKPDYLNRLDWLDAACPVVYAFRNTADGYKALYQDGIFAEFAVFEPGELAQAAFAAGRVIWKTDDFDASLAFSPQSSHPPEEHTLEWLLGEALTNLYIGLCRFHRGEKLSAMRFVQVYAVDRLVELASRLEVESPAIKDPFSGERRFEQRFPNLAAELPDFLQGYDGTPRSAHRILEFLDENFEVNPAIKDAILKLL